MIGRRRGCLPEQIDRSADDVLLDAYSAAVVRAVEIASHPLCTCARVSREEGTRSDFRERISFVLSPDGLVLTNSHVVHGATVSSRRLPTDAA